MSKDLFTTVHTPTPPAPASPSRVEIAPWKRYNLVEKEVGSLDGEKVQCLYADRGKPGDAPKPITGEFFNHELQKCDTSDAASVIEFCTKYGLPFSPLYPGKQYFLAGHYRSTKCRFPDDGNTTRTENNPSNPGFVSDEEGGDPHAAIRWNSICKELMPFISPKHRHCGRDDVAWGCYASIYARRTVYFGNEDSSKIGGIVSVAELQTTIRLLQTMMPLISLWKFLEKNPQDPAWVYKYLSNKKYINQNGPWYFFGTGAIPAPPTEPFVGQTARELIDKHGYPDMEAAEQAARDHLFSEYADELREGIRNAASFFSLVSQHSIGPFSTLLPEAKANNDDSWADRALAKIALAKDGSSNEDDIVANGESGSLTEALLSLFSFELSQDFPWRQCEYCGRIFKFYKDTNLLTARTLRQRAYCKRSCSVMSSAKS